MSSNSSSTTTRSTGATAIQELKQLYTEKKEPIHTRLLEFREILQQNDHDVFAELCFCLLTPQSSAKVCWAAVTRLKEKSLLLKGTPDELEPLIRDVRFNDSKARYIVEARNQFTKNGELRVKPHLQSFLNTYELREWLVENVKGLGYKEASHFLRNIGLGEEFAILDRHILRNLKDLEVLPEIPATLTKKRYLEIEEKVRRFSKEIGIPMADLDLLLWSKETGWIFK
jgi:N-glycosylase/DNA lyase